MGGEGERLYLLIPACVECRLVKHGLIDPPHTDVSNWGRVLISVPLWTTAMDTTKTSQADEDATWNQELKSLLRLLIAQSQLKKKKT